MTPPVSLPSGSKITAAKLADLQETIGLFVRKTGDEVIGPTTTLQDDDQLVVPVAANTTYLMECQLRYVGDTTADLKWAFAVPAGALLNYSALHVPAGATALVYTDLVNNDVGTADITGRYVRMRGVITTGATPGNLRLQWAQNIANNTTTMQTFSLLLLRRV